MPTRKSSPTKAKKSPAQSRSRSRSASRSRSQTKKSVTRSRSRSTARSTVTEVKVQQKSKSPARTPKKTASPARTPKKAASPGRPAKKTTSTPAKSSAKVVEVKSAKVIQREEPVVPSRVSRRVVESTSYRVTRSSVADKGDVKTITTTTVSQTSSDGGLGYAGILMVVFMLLISFLLALSCTKKSCSAIKMPVCPATWEAYFNLEVVAVLLAFYAAVVLLALVPVGSIVPGQPLRDGLRINYRCNGWLTLLVVAAVFGYAMTQKVVTIQLSYVHVHLLQFLTANVILTIAMSVLLFILGRDAPYSARSPASDGTFWNDFCMGRVLNPRFGPLDLKHVLARLTMIVWLVIDWMYIMDQFKRTQKIEPALGVVVLCHSLYILFLLKNEHTMFSSNDFMREGGGFMFCWAAFCFIPYVCIFQTRFLYMYPKEGVENPYALAAVFLVNAVGLMFFIGANWQKSEFRKNPYNPELAHLSSIPTATGKRLLCSGWWGIVRRPNYLGDLMMALAWSLPCGCNYALAYVYPVYLVILLVGRVISDEKSCHQRYGEAWVKYTETVRYRLIPGIF